LTRRELVDRFQPQGRSVLLQSMALKHRRAALFRRWSGRLHDAEAKQLDSTSVQPFETEGINRRAISASL
jgi:hypothetical protein